MIAVAAGIPLPDRSDGISRLPLLKENVVTEHKFINWEFHRAGPASKNFRQSVCVRNMKEVLYRMDTLIEIYNLEIDISVTASIAINHPELVE